MSSEVLGGAGEYIVARILAVDDEPKNLVLIRGFLSREGYDIDTAEDGAIAWEMLKASARDKYDVVLLDRMMPNMDGMELMENIKTAQGFNDIPLIMQTAAADKAQVAEGIAAGVYYYLTKPYSREALVSIVKAAVDDREKRQASLNQVSKYEKVSSMVIKSKFCFSTLEEARDLISYLADFFPDPAHVSMGIGELLINAVEHGNLGITYDEKTSLNNAGTWEKEVIRRQRLPENLKKKIMVSYRRTKEEISLLIKDDGEGFDWNPYLVFDPGRMTDNHGRGIAMSKTACFDSLEYRGTGNEVCCKVFLGNRES